MTDKDYAVAFFNLGQSEHYKPVMDFLRQAFVDREIISRDPNDLLVFEGARSVLARIEKLVEQSRARMEEGERPTTYSVKKSK